MREDYKELERVVRKEKPLTPENFLLVVRAAKDHVGEWDSMRAALVRESNKMLKSSEIDYEITERDTIEPERIESELAPGEIGARDEAREQLGSLLAQYFQSHLFAETTMKGLQNALDYSIEAIVELKKELEKTEKKANGKTQRVIVRKPAGFSKTELLFLRDFEKKHFYWHDLVGGKPEEEIFLLSCLLSKLLSEGVVSAEREEFDYTSKKGVSCRVSRYKYFTDLGKLNYFVSLKQEEVEENAVARKE